MSTPTRPTGTTATEDALLSGLSRLKAAVEPIPRPALLRPPDSSARLRPRPRPRGTNSRASSTASAASLNVPYAYFPHPSSTRRPDPLIPVSRADILEQVERATGLHRAGGGDVAAAEKLLRWIRAGSAAVVDVFNGIVSGSTRNDAPLNARVLSVVAWLCVNGGPVVIHPAVYVVNARRPSPGLRVCIDVLKSLGYDSDPESVLHDDNRVRELARMREMDAVGKEGSKGRKAESSREALFEAALEAYAIALGRKLVFHRRFPEVEANYSLDRHYRKLRIEEDYDKAKREVNLERLSLVISKTSLGDAVLITKSAVAAMDWLERAGAPGDIFVLAAAEACNAYAFSEYLRRKLGVKPTDDYDLEEEKFCLAQKLLALERRGSPSWRLLRRYVEGNIIRAITEQRVRVYRPESKHRREVLCTFTSFHAMHMALGPTSHAHRDIAE